MMYMHYCKSCHRVYMLNGHKQQCPKCHKVFLELKISYMDYVTMNQEERIRFCNCCADEEQLQQMVQRTAGSSASDHASHLSVKRQDRQAFTCQKSGYKFKRETFSDLELIL